MTDPIADMITRIRNAVHARHPRVDIPASRFKVEIARILEQEGYVSAVKLVEGDESTRSAIRITLKYAIRHRNRCKRCGRPRAYLRKFALCRLCFRKLALEGDVAGVVKSSW